MDIRRSKKQAKKNRKEREMVLYSMHEAVARGLTIEKNKHEVGHVIMQHQRHVNE